jgi:hypothetical protein
MGFSLKPEHLTSWSGCWRASDGDHPQFLLLIGAARYSLPMLIARFIECVYSISIGGALDEHLSVCVYMIRSCICVRFALVWALMLSVGMLCAYRSGFVVSSLLRSEYGVVE